MKKKIFKYSSICLMTLLLTIWLKLTSYQTLVMYILILTNWEITDFIDKNKK
jgi:hypothetical protein|nr:MAG TPA: hypothetical protein [Ackermannviridae sp.]